MKKEIGDVIDNRTLCFDLLDEVNPLIDIKIDNEIEELYVVIDGKVNRILSDFTEINQDYVYVKKDGDNYKLSLVPFTKEDYNYTENKKKHSYSTKSKKVKQENEE